MERNQLEAELIHCSCGHEFEAFHNDLGTYLCPECFERIKKVSRLPSHPDLKALDVALRKLEEQLPYPWGHK